MARRRRPKVSIVRVHARPPMRHIRRIGSRHTLTSRLSVQVGDAAVAAAAGAVGQVLQQLVTSRWPAAPAILARAPVEALGLYALGVLLSRPEWRDIGAGLALGRYIGLGLGGGAAVGP